jgi:hypothetical protein
MRFGTIEWMAANADLIVIGRVISSASIPASEDDWFDDIRPHAVVTMEVEQRLKGEEINNGDKISAIINDHNFQANDRILLFLGKWQNPAVGLADTHDISWTPKIDFLAGFKKLAPWGPLKTNNQCFYIAAARKQIHFVFF